MARKPLKKPSPNSSKSSPRRRSSTAPQAGPAPPTPRRSVPLNFLLRALSTPPRPPSHHPFLRAFSTPLRRRSEYSPLVRRLCQRGAHERLPYDNHDFVDKILACEGCGQTGTMTQNLAFKQGHAGEWVRVCRNVACGLIYYPAQPGTPPGLLQEIEAARDAGERSSTMTTPDSRPSRSSTFAFSTPSQDFDSPSPIRGELEDWLSPLLRELDMKPSTHASPTSSLSSEPVAGPSTGPALGVPRNVPPSCERDEQIARMLQAAADAEDALFLQQLEDESSPGTPPETHDRDQQATTLSSLTEELTKITQSQAIRTKASLAAAASPARNTPSDHSSPESSPSPRPRKKKRVLVKPPPTPPRVPRKIYGPVPSERGRKVSARSTKLAKYDKHRTEKPAKPPAEPVKTDAAHSAPRRDAPSPVFIVISSDDERAPPTQVTEGGDQSTAVPPGSQPQTASSLPDPPTLRPLRAAQSRPSGGDDDDIIDITSSDSDGDDGPPATQPRVSSRKLASRQVADDAHSAQSDSERDTAPLRTRSRTSLAGVEPHPPRGRRRLATRAPIQRSRPDSPARTSSVDPPARASRADPASRASRADPPAHASRADPASRASRAETPVRASRAETPARASRAPSTRPAASADKLAVIDITSSDDESLPPSTQPRTASSRVVVRSRAPLREVAASARHSPSGLENDEASSETPFRGTRSHPVRTPTHSSPSVVNPQQDGSEAGSSNKENKCSSAVQSCRDMGPSLRLSVRQAVARRRPGVFATLAQTSSSSFPSSSSSSGSVNHGSDDEAHRSSDEAHESSDEARQSSDRTVHPVAPIQSGAADAGERIDAAEAFGDPFRFELYPVVPGLVTSINPYAERRHWILTVKIWYKNNLQPSTKMIALDHVRCSIRLSDVFIIARTFQSTGITNFRVWNRSTTDWETRSPADYLDVSVTDNHMLLICFPTVTTLTSWAENISQAYGVCQTIDPRPPPSRKGKEPAYY